MAEIAQESLAAANSLHKLLGGVALPPLLAKLYSQHTRLRAQQPGLAGWGRGEAALRLDDAVRLLEAGLIERETRSPNWQESIRRTGEILEWISHPEMNLGAIPTHLLAAAAYQLAGFPARSTSLLIEKTRNGSESPIIQAFLRADFPLLLGELVSFWANHQAADLWENPLQWNNPEKLSAEIQARVAWETASCLGVLCSEMRWGEETRLPLALAKFETISKLLLHGADPYSWLLAKLFSEVAALYSQDSIRSALHGFETNLSAAGKNALERYLRQKYRASTSLAWPSQRRGITKLMEGRSFALCTPTGSGKTTVAELAIIQSLFTEVQADSQADPQAASPIAMYLTPTRALATEVESKLARSIRNLSDEQVIVTGLYGGTDWGPTDAWLTSDSPTVLICTYEKAEALMRFLGPLFLRRVSTIVIDEAHSLQFNGKPKSLLTGENRSLRLESLGARLLAQLDEKQARAIALSAVAAGFDGTLASWISHQAETEAVKSSYRSTRQLIGRLECLPQGTYQIVYDLLDGATLQFIDSGGQERPFVPNPIPPCPDPPAWWKKQASGPEKRTRPQLFWAAMNLASLDARIQQTGVLISVTQGIVGYARDFLNLLDSHWLNKTAPVFFQAPSKPDEERVWKKCLEACEDYFGKASYEYQLLKKGIALHHGKMPGPLARYLVEAIEMKIIHLVLATSTLSEGVNLPFETILIPTLRRGQSTIGAQEFANLAGRAGRPGFATEGRTLVLLQNAAPEERELAWSIEMARRAYSDLIQELSDSRTAPVAPKSALAELITLLKEHWNSLATGGAGDFLSWLEQTAPLTVPEEQLDDRIQALDSLDSILLSAIVEMENGHGLLSQSEMEGYLKGIWQRSYAHYAAREEKELEKIFTRRGSALPRQIYTDPSQRRRFYRTSLSPRAANQVLELFPVVREHLEKGRDYAHWDASKRLTYITRVFEELSKIPKFALEEKIGKAKGNWRDVLHWWLDPESATSTPTPDRVSGWYDYVSNNFTYRLNWGLGAIIALAIDEAPQGQLTPLTLDDWTKTGLPWIVFWLKELVVWGTLEPPSAYLLASGAEVTRPKAQATAQRYYQAREQIKSLDPNDIFDPRAIRDWANGLRAALPDIESSVPPKQLPVKLEEDFTGAGGSRYRVLPAESDNKIYWLDIAGFLLASSDRPATWSQAFLDRYDFELDSKEKRVVSRRY